ncbi:MAG: flavodoxin family protein [Anaerovoracaceae bacterium]
MKVTAAYFSPTEARKIYEAIAGSLDENFMTVDLTRAENRRKSFSSVQTMVILGAPVYAGRLSIVEEGLFQNLKGQGTRTILVVTYGNRDFDDAL